MKYLNVLKLLCFGSLLTSCSNLTDCEKNFIEGTGLSERAYLSIQGDSEKFLTRAEVKQLIATIPLNGNSPRERSNNTFNSATQLNECIKADLKSFFGKTGSLGCYEGYFTISEKEFEVQNPQENQKFSVKELAGAIREKYPEQSEMSDEALVNTLIDQYPEYAEKVDFGEPGKKVATDSPSTGEEKSSLSSQYKSREDFINQYREATGVSKEDMSDINIAYNAAKLYPELKEMLGVKTEGYEVDWSSESKKAKGQNKKNSVASEKTLNKSYRRVSVDFDVNGYFIVHQEKKRYFNTNNEVNLRFEESVPNKEDMTGEVEVYYKLDRLKLKYEQKISTYQYGQLGSILTTSGVLLKTTSDTCD